MDVYCSSGFGDNVIYVIIIMGLLHTKQKWW